MASDAKRRKCAAEDGSECIDALALQGTATAAIHADSLLADPAFSTDADVAPPLSFSTTFSSGAHVYSRISAPTRSRCEALLGAVEGTEEQPAHAVLYSSGLAACFAAFSRLLPRRVFISGGYHGTHLVLEQLQRISAGARCQKEVLVPPEELVTKLEAGDLIWLETPLNPTCEVADMAAYVAAAKSCKEVHVVVDGTFAPPPLQRPLLLGVDMVMHATTKGLAGHSDALGGAICVSDPELAKRLRQDRLALGSTPGSMEVWLLLRSLRTLHLRVERQSCTAGKLAAWLYEATQSESHPLRGLVHAVHHPSLKSCTYHEVAKRQMPGGYGSCMAIELTSEAAAKALPGSLKLFKDATSLGGVESLIEWRRKYDSAISPRLLRISIGLEEFEHLQKDMQHGILQATAACEG